MSGSTLSATKLAPKKRYHALDALRAFAMLMGIVLHLAIYFLPFHITGMIAESSGSDGFTYIVYVTHMFRMQVFFLMAGFFARLVFRRIGYFGFAWHRFTRIAIPFAVGWVIMYPMITLYHVWAAVETQSLLTDQSFGPFVISCIMDDVLEGFSLIHLWFLYYLLLSYGVVIAGEWLLRYVLDRSGRIRVAFKRLFRWQMHSRFNVIWLVIPLWPLLYYKGDWFGIITPADSLKPDWAVVITYTLFFLVGWLLHAQARLLRRFESSWQFNLVSGIAISVALFAFFEYGRSNGSITMAYPLMFESEVHDYAVFRSSLLQTNDSETADNHKCLREALPPLYQQLVDETPILNDGQMSGITMELSKKLILEPTAFQPMTEGDQEYLAQLKAEAARRGHTSIPIDTTTEGTPEQNRWLVEAAFPPGLFATNIAARPYFRVFMVAFAAVYALGTWLLIFGLIGFFLRFFDNPSPMMRYIADSSYWLYLVHFPILWNINVLTPDIKWHWLPKSLLYLVVSLAIMMPSYHYLVRSTWLGRVLNGRTYPFRPWFRRASGEAVEDSDLPYEPSTTGEA